MVKIFSLLKNKFSTLASLLSLCSIVSCIILNYDLAKLYIKASGKTKALFGIIELSRLDLKTWIFIAGLTALILSLVAIKRKENKKLYQFSFVISLIAMILVFIRIWKWMI